MSLSRSSHLVVIGNGTAAIRLVEELVRRQAPSSAMARRVTVIGDEPGPAYNRILLSAVLEGSHPVAELRLRDEAWYAGSGVALISGIRVVRIDRDERVVWLADGRSVPYDDLVLATGSVPALPPIRGLVTPGGELSPKVHAFRSMADCLGLLGALPQARRAVVIGGGLLGLQVARALGVRGLEVDMVEATPHLLASHLGETAGAVLRRSVEELGCEVYPGGILVGDASAYGVLRPMVASGIALPENPEELILPPARGFAQVGMPDEAVVCSCENVTKATICAAIDGTRDGVQGTAGCADIGCIKACTKAGTVCGSCVPTVRNLLAERLASAGREVSNALCEHFAMSRQELFDLVAVKQIRSFTVLVAAHGTGRGCDICKPAVASILASQTSDHILAEATAALQDTNDAFLGNLQRNGTYSVVPRVPGGELTAEKLIVIGEVARDFDLYTKITGGQRIDLFGARVEQLPLIWRRLVGAGFESGHAYGKALRTVKSCVGQAWCRYGVQDSTKLAIELELRYRGLRAPHKLKGGVSGCARECAEARGKDFGIIATEKGWNLYVGGNGGFRPAHAAELAIDLDTPTLIRYLDRFLMFYIRTADRLQRTSVWLESIEGGLDYVRSVVVDDSLGLAADLEADMAGHIGAYQDEWRATLEDEDKLARFVSFINAPDTPDPSIAFVTERGQIRPVAPVQIAEPVLIASLSIPVGAPR